jgi:nucleoside-diphosphate-sugar epimerase
MARVLVTGVDGFTGRYLAPLLAAQGHEVHGLVRDADMSPIDGVSALHVSDLLNPAGLRQVVEAVQPERVAHLAGIAFVGHGDVGAIYRTNYVGVFHLLAVLSALATRPKAVLLASSANIYGNTDVGVIDESVPAAPANDYAFSKWAMECTAARWVGQLPITIARPFNYTGRGQSIDFVMPKIVSHFSRKAALLELGNLDVEREFNDVRMVVDCYARLLDRPVQGGVFNICSGQGHALRSVLAMAQSISGHTPEVRVNPAFVRANEVKKLVGSRAALEKAIGPVQGPTLHETLAWMLA